MINSYARLIVLKNKYRFVKSICDTKYDIASVYEKLYNSLYK